MPMPQAQQKQILANYGITMDDVKKARSGTGRHLNLVSLATSHPVKVLEDTEHSNPTFTIHLQINGINLAPGAPK